MSSGGSAGLATQAHSALALTLRTLQRFLEDPKVTELCVNRPGEVFLETAAGWRS
jgi:type IV secretory pathway ATPase VirB11/archaellum biosynthesis ATPase